MEIILLLYLSAILIGRVWSHSMRFFSASLQGSKYPDFSTAFLNFNTWFQILVAYKGPKSTRTT